jgi:hypothetical protein
MAQTVNLIPQKGERCLSVGQTGSGKTYLNLWLLLRIPFAPIIIYDTKDEPKFQKLPASVVVETMDQALEKVKDDTVDYIIVRPPASLMGEPEILDEMLWIHYNELKGIPAYIDEAYTFHKNAKAGRGLIALLTRGRSKGITTIISTQRPVLISRFCITEANKLYVLRLTDKQDRKRIDDMIPNYSDEENPPKHGFYFFEAGETEEPILFKPIKLDRMFDTGYSDASDEEQSSTIGNNPEAIDKPPIKHIWI